MAHELSIKAAEFIRMADRIAEGDSPELLRNAPNERKNKKLFLKEDRFEKSSGTYSSLAEAQKSKYAALAGKESEQSDNFFEKAYGLGTQKDMLQSQVKKEASQSKNDEKDSEDKKELYEFDPGNKELNESEKKQVEELKKIDVKVRAHEMAHQTAGAGLVRGKSFQYTTGPDGRQYATGGEVKIDISADPDDPEKTIRKMQKVRRAALAPVDPSSTDRVVAAKASQMEAMARSDKAELSLKDNKSIGNKERQQFDKYLNDGKQDNQGKLIDRINGSGIASMKGVGSLKVEEAPPPPPPEPPPPPPEPVAE